MFQLPDGTISDPVHVTCGTKQGDPLSPLLFTAVLDLVLGPLARRWCQQGLGFCMDESRVPFLVLADDITLIATSAAQLECMMASLQVTLAKVGLEVTIDKCEWTCNCPDTDNHRVRLGDSVLVRRGRDKGIRLLETQVTLVNSCRVEWEHRFAVAWGSFFARKQALCCNQASLKARCKLLMTTVHKSLTWSLEVLTPTKAQVKRLSSIQLQRVRKMMRHGRLPGEQWVDWQRRTLRLARRWLQRNRCDTWGLKWRQKYSHGRRIWRGCQIRELRRSSQSAGILGGGGMNKHKAAAGTLSGLSRGGGKIGFFRQPVVSKWTGGSLQ